MVFTIFLHEERLVFKDQSLDLTNFMRPNSAIPAQRYWLKPEFTFPIRSCNMNVGWFLRFIGVEMKQKRTNPEHCWHITKLTATDMKLE